MPTPELDAPRSLPTPWDGGERDPCQPLAADVGGSAGDGRKTGARRAARRGQVPRRARPGTGRHGDGGRRAPRAAGRAGRAQVPAVGGAGHPGRPGALHARGASGGEDQERTRGARLRRGAARQRDALHGDGVPGRQRPGGVAARAGAHARRAGGRLRAPGLRGRRRGARAGHRASRPQAVEPLLRAASRRAAFDQGARLRHLEDDDAGRARP